MDHQGFHVRDVRQQREQLQAVDELLGLLLSSVDLDREDRSGTVREVPLIQRMAGMLGKGRVADAPDLRVLLQVG